MANIWYLFIFIILSAYAQQNANRVLSPYLRDCYENKFLLERDNRLPHTLNTFIAILRKIENSNGLNMDLRSLSVALLHRFRQDGITRNPSIPDQDGITPYAPHTYHFYRFAETLRYIPESGSLFPNNTITDVERCTLHFMLSISVEDYERGDETKVCRFVNAYRYPRNVNDNDKVINDIVNEVETLTSDEIKTHDKNRDKDIAIDPNSWYPELPPNHPDNARISALSSKCPIENGVVKTPWGATSLGLVLAGIAAALQPQIVNVTRSNISDVKQQMLDNKWIATLAGDLAEVALRQGPKNETFSVGVTGNWNSTALPRWYFLNSNEKFEMTTAEIRGDLDGLILANQVSEAYSNVPRLRLSQIFDMYYNRLGFFKDSIKACNRGTLFTSVASTEKMIEQTNSASLVLKQYIHATLGSTVIERFSVQAVNALSTYVPLHLSKDLSCDETVKLYNLNPISVDLTIILDTKWKFETIKPTLAHLLENIDLNQFNSNFTLINGHDGMPMINSTFNILEFYDFNSSQYENVTHGFNLAKSLEQLEISLMHKLNHERSLGVGGARSDVVLIVPNDNQIPQTDKEYCSQTISRMREKIPDTTLLIMTRGSKDFWSSLVHNRITDSFSISTGDTEEALQSIMNVVLRIRQVPKRLFNTQCGSNYIPSGSAKSYDDYIVPNGINYYKLHPNYFFSDGIATKITIQASEANNLIVCSSRMPLNDNATEVSKSCGSISSNQPHVITVSCTDATLIHECPPLYISIASNSSTISYQCTDTRVCRFPSLIKYTVSYKDVVCTSDATKMTFNSFILIIALVFFMYND